MLGKLISGVVGSHVAEQSGKSGALGAVGGLVANRIIKRSPIGALVIGGAWVAHKLYKRKQERDEQAAALAAKPVKAAKKPAAKGL